jgi:regulator of sigma E protease
MLQNAQLALLYTLPFLAVLTLVVSIHELGHFLTARACGVAVDAFSIGFGQPVFSRRDKHGTEWRIGWMPLGGYVRFALDENIASVPDAENVEEMRRQVLAKEGPAGLKRYLVFKPLWQRAAVAAAGPVANLILAVAIFTTFAAFIGVPRVKPIVDIVTPGTPASHAGFMHGDLILRANGDTVDDFADLRRLVMLHSGDAIRFDVQRRGAVIRLVATPVRKDKSKGPAGAQDGAGYLGIQASSAPGDAYMAHVGPLEALGYGVKSTKDTIGLSLTYVSRVVLGRENGQMISSFLGMGKATGDMAQEVVKGSPDLATGAVNMLVNMLSMAGFISVALGFANLLPIPPLDGGHLLFYAYEAVARRPLAARVQDAGYRVGIALVIALMIFAVVNDLRRFGVFQFIGGLFL